MADRIVITGLNVTSECKKTVDNKDLSMSFWAEGCLYWSKSQLYDALISNANYF